MENSLPKNWVKTELGNYLFLKNGYAFNSSDFTTEGISIVRISNIQNGEIDLSDSVFVDKSLFKSEFQVEKGDILIAMSGATTGKYGIYNSNDIALQNQRVGNLKVRYPELSNKKFVYYLLSNIKPIIEELAYGGAQPNISPKLIEGIIIPIPPLSEQIRISEKLDRLFVQLDIVKTSINKIPRLLKELRQQIFMQAIAGILTEKWREGKSLENVEEIINKIKNSRINENKNKKTELQKLHKIYSDYGSSVDFIIPIDWIEVNLDKVCDSFSYGTSSKSANYGKYPVVRMGNIQEGKINWNDLKYTSNENEYEKYKLRKGDVLFNRTNSPELVGKTAIYDGVPPAIFAGYLIKITNCHELNPKYLNIVLNTQYAKKWCWNNKTDGVSQSNINAQKLSKFTIPFPSPEEQKQIVNRVERNITQIEEIQSKYNILKQKIDVLPQAILNTALNGRLVLQLPTDGDAKDLLKEIEELNKSIKKK